MEGLDREVLAQPPAVALLRRDVIRRVVAGTREPVLLDDDPSVVADEGVEEASEVDVAGAEFAERAVSPRLGPITGVLDHLERDVLEVHVPDATAPVPHPVHRIAA